MSIIDEIEGWGEELTAWRRDLHAHPEIAFEEERTAAFVAEKLRGFGLDPATGMAKTGVVASIKGRAGAGAIGLRADLDALPMKELNEFAYRSRHEGRMHACGHDGHTVMLLAAARYLARHRDFAGTAHLIFQPAEEHEGGAKAMLDEGLLRRFPCDQIYGLHNHPGLPEGDFGVRAGPLLASNDTFDIAVTGKGAHGAFPHQGLDPMPIAAAIITGLQQIVARVVDPLQAAVVSVTKISGGSAYNIIPETVTFGGTLRAFLPAVRDQLHARVREIATGIAAAHGARASVAIDARYPPTINAADAAEMAAKAAAAVVGAGRVRRDQPPNMAADDIAYLLIERPGAHVLIGNGAGDDRGACACHNPNYDFNDALLPIGASFWVRLVEQRLGS